MRLYHVSVKSCQASISREGISPAYSTGNLEAVWLVSEKYLDWAMLHVQRRHAASLSDILVYEVWVSRLKLRRTNRPGRWCTVKTIPTSAILDTYDSDDMEKAERDFAEWERQRYGEMGQESRG